MLKHHQLQGVLCVALTVAGLLLTSCTSGASELAVRPHNRAAP
jgi:hypothetical protein